MRRTKKLALTALVAALVYVILLLGAFVEILDLSAALCASFLILFCVAELGYRSALSAFGISAILALFFLPNKTPAILFSAIFGYLPITKFFFEKYCKRLAILPKLLLFNGASIASGLLFWEVFGLTTANIFGFSETVMKILYLVLANAVFLLSDALYARLILLYIRKYRDRFRKYLK